ncbi:DUF1819 family protein [Clostridium estertheticum]|uniref:DUF1819 family protein n=1 Tax=Clostridium estertheticum TaxID=238834 RepID=UPI001CD0952F|nr:DUF1819 family protein [Clostridium estertheticum]MBZ9684970.1 DUF1819 family protein [Clostridium estertheticum]
MELEYSAKLTGESFLMYEFKIIAKLKKEGYSDKDIRKMVLEENLFQYKFKSSITRRLTPLIQRINIIDDNLINMLLLDPLGDGSIINLYAIMKNDRLFFEFMNEVVRERILTNDLYLEKKDINVFITEKKEQSEVVDKWTDETIAKLKQVIFKILSEAGVLEDKKSGKLSRLIITSEIKDYLIDIGDKVYIQAMGEYMI